MQDGEVCYVRYAYRMPDDAATAVLLITPVAAARQLIQPENAALGQLVVGVAHELNNL